MHLNLPIAEYRNLLGEYLRPHKSRVALLAALLLGVIALQLVNPQVIRYFIDATQQQNGANNLALAGLAFIIIGLLQRALALGTTYVGVNLSWDATNALRAKLTNHLLRLDMPFHKTHTPGELIERVDGDVTALANFFSQFIVNVLGAALLILGVLVFTTITNLFVLNNLASEVQNIAKGLIIVAAVLLQRRGRAAAP